jgi:hypothetical protein
MDHDEEAKRSESIERLVTACRLTGKLAQAESRKAAAATEAFERVGTGDLRAGYPEHFPASLLPDRGAVCGALRAGAEWPASRERNSAPGRISW